MGSLYSLNLFLIQASTPTDSSVDEAGLGENIANRMLNAMGRPLVDVYATVMPSTPDNLKLANLVSPLLSTGTSFGDYFVGYVLETVLLVAGLVALYKFVKILPFT